MKNRFTPPDMILVIILLEFLMHHFLPIKQIISYPYNLLGIILLVVGMIPNFWVYFQFKGVTPRDIYEMPKKLITSGLFKISRNPVYLGMALILTGLAILLGSLISFIFPIIFIILTDKFIFPTEEKNLEKTFGKKYKEYKKRVRRWI